MSNLKYFNRKIVDSTFLFSPSLLNCTPFFSAILRAILFFIITQLIRKYMNDSFYPLCHSISLSLSFCISFTRTFIWMMFTCHKSVYGFLKQIVHHNHIQSSKWYAVSFLLLSQLLYTKLSAFTLYLKKNVWMYFISCFVMAFFLLLFSLCLISFLLVLFLLVQKEKETVSRSTWSTWVRERKKQHSTYMRKTKMLTG